MNNLVVLCPMVLFASCVSGTKPKDIAGFPAVKLEHVYVKISDSDYQAIQRSSVLKKNDLFFSEMNKNVGQWTGHYIQGTQGYIEFFNRETLPKSSHIGELGLGFLAEDKGIVDQIHSMFPASAPGKFEERKFDFSETKAYRTSYSWTGPTALWIAEAKSSFVGRDGAISRSDLMAYFRNKAKVSTVPAANEIISLTVALNRDKFTFYSKTLAALGFIESSESTFRKDQQSIRLVEGDTEGIKEVVFSIDTDKEFTERFGSVALVVKEKRATWSF